MKQNELTDERLIMLQTQYEDEKARSNDLQQKLNEAKNQKIEIECKLKSSSSSSSLQSQTALSKENEELVNEMKTKMIRVQSQLDDELKKNRKFEENIEYLSKKLWTCFKIQKVYTLILIKLTLIPMKKKRFKFQSIFFEL